MRRHVLLLFCVLLCCLNCDDEEECETLCENLDSCGFLPSPMGTDRDNCVSKCVASSDIPDQLRSCIGEQGPNWNDRSREKTDDVRHNLALDKSGCPAYSECLSFITGDTNLQGYGRVMLIPTETPWSGTDQKLDRACTMQVAQETAEEICAGWGIARATALLDDGKTHLRGSFGACATTLAHQPIFTHVLVGRLRAALVLEGRIESPSAGDTGGGAAGASGSGAGAEGGAAGSASSEPERCFVFAAPTQVNDAGLGCVGIVIPFERDIAKARTCEGGAECTDNLDNDGDGWADCEDPKCEAYCAQFMSAASATDAGGAGATLDQP